MAGTVKTNHFAVFFESAVKRINRQFFKLTVDLIAISNYLGIITVK